MTDIAQPINSPEKPDAPKAPKDFSLLGKVMKLASFPIAGFTGFWVMNNAARGEIIEIELESTKGLKEGLKEKHDDYTAKRSKLSQAVDTGAKSASEALAEREANHIKWRAILYDNLEKKGFKSFKNKFKHLRRVDQQKIIVEGVAVGSIIIGAVFAIANSDIFRKHEHKDDGQSR